MSRTLRDGFTTGTAAAAAAKAATLLLLTGEQSTRIDTPLPPGGRLVVTVDTVAAKEKEARASVIKDGGDDPDATHGHRIESVVRLDPDAPKGSVTIAGGTGVGKVTLPGLPVPVGEPAINPAPRTQITTAVREALSQNNYRGGAQVIVEVPQGEAIALKTLNARLGIIGGISILGTRGTVKPFSHESYEATIRQSMDIAVRQGISHIALATGGRTESLLRNDLPHLPTLAFVQFADFFQSALSQASAHGFRTISIGCYFGKLVKMAHGFGYTHAHGTRIDFNRVAQWLGRSGVAPSICNNAKQSITARHVLDLIRDDPAMPQAIEYITSKALAHAREFAGPLPRIELRVYDFNGVPLCTKLPE